MFSLRQTSVLIIPLGQLSDSKKLISLIPLGGSLEVTPPLAVKLLDNQLYMLDSSVTYILVKSGEIVLGQTDNLTNVKDLNYLGGSCKRGVVKTSRPIHVLVV